MIKLLENHLKGKLLVELNFLHFNWKDKKSAMKDNGKMVFHMVKEKLIMMMVLTFKDFSETV